MNPNFSFRAVCLFLLSSAIAMAQQWEVRLDGSAEVEARSQYTIRARLYASIVTPAEFPAFTCTIHKDTACGKYHSASIWHQDILDGTPYTVVDNDSEVVLQTLAPHTITKDGSLFSLTFTAADPDTERTAAMRIRKWTFDGGRAAPDVFPKSFMVFPYRLFFSGCNERGANVNWDPVGDAYLPDTVWIYSQAWQTRSDTAKNVRFTLRYDTSALQLLWPSVPTQPALPLDIAPNSGGVERKWAFRAKPRYQFLKTFIFDSISSDNFAPKVCAHPVFIAPVTTSLSCAVAFPQPRCDSLLSRYVPSPLPVEVRVKNTGKQRSDSVSVRITVPDFVWLEGQPGRTSELLRIPSAILQPGEEAVLHWQLVLPPSGTARSGRVLLSADAANTDEARDTAQLVLPPVPAARLEAICSYPETLRYVTAAKAVLPDTFSVSARFVNTGSAALYNGRAALILQDYFALREVGDSVQSLMPSALRAGDTSSLCRWRVRFTGTRRTPMPYRFAWRFSGTSAAGDSIAIPPVSCGEGIAEGYPPVLSCMLDAPDTILLAAGARGRASTALTVHARVANVSAQEQRIRSITVTFPQLRLNDASGNTDMWMDGATPEKRLLDTLLAPADTLTLEWILHVDYGMAFASGRLGVQVVAGDGTLLQRDRLLHVRKQRAFEASIRRIARDYPNNYIELSAFCDGIEFSTMDTTLFTLYENGHRIWLEEIYCPGNYGRSRQSLGFVMATGPQRAAEARILANAFIDNLDENLDQAAVLSRDASAPLLRGFTMDKEALDSALTSACKPATGGLVDAIHAATAYMHDNAARDATASLIVFTDGTDNGSLHTLGELLDTLDIPWRTGDVSLQNLLIIGLGTSANGQAMRELVNAAQVWAWYVENPSYSVVPDLAGSLMPGWGLFEHCTLYYPAPCPDGSNRELTLEIKGACPGNDTTVLLTSAYKALYLPSEFTPLNLRLGFVETRPDTAVTVPLLLETKLRDDSLRACSVRIVYDTLLLRFDSLSLGGCLLNGAIRDVRVNADTIFISTIARYFALAEGRLADVRFHAKATSDTVESPVRFVDWHFVHGCRTPALTDGKVRIAPPGLVDVPRATLPAQWTLEQNHPNPCSQRTRIAYTVGAPGLVRIEVLDLLGRVVATLVAETQQAGLHSVECDVSGLKDGVYLYRMQGHAASRTKKLLVHR